MSIALNPSEKPAPPIRRTPSMNTNCQPPPPQQQQPIHNNYIELQSRLKARLKRAEELADQFTLINSQSKTTTTTAVVTQSKPPNTVEDFPPPPPEFLAEHSTNTSSTNSTHSSLLNEIQRGFKLRKTVTVQDRSAPRLK